MEIVDISMGFLLMLSVCIFLTGNLVHIYSLLHLADMWACLIMSGTLLGSVDSQLWIKQTKSLKLAKVMV